MKKFFSTLAASLMAVSALTAVSASAVNAEKDVVSITTETLSAAITADNGTVIPSGATAVTVSISNNSGFVGKSVKLDIGSDDAIIDESGNLVVDSGDVLGDSLIGSAENNGIVMLAAASADELNSDGDMFTFYVSDSSADVSIIAIDPQIQIAPENQVMPFATRYSYLIGDVNLDGYVNSIDASNILSAVSTYEDESFGGVLTVDIANSNLLHFFPYDTPRFAQSANCTDDNYITRYDAQCVMNFYMAASTDEQYDFEKVCHAGETGYLYI